MQRKHFRRRVELIFEISPVLRETVPYNEALNSSCNIFQIPFAILQRSVFSSSHFRRYLVKFFFSFSSFFFLFLFFFFFFFLLGKFRRVKECLRTFYFLFVLSLVKDLLSRKKHYFSIGNINLEIMIYI